MSENVSSLALSFKPEHFSYLPSYACSAHGTQEGYLRMGIARPGMSQAERVWCMLCVEDLLLAAGLQPMTPIETKPNISFLHGSDNELTQK